MREIYLANGRGVALVDSADYERVSQYRWFFANGYAYRKVRLPDGGYTFEAMHTLLMGHRAGHTPDHINRNKLDNRRQNLRWATGSEQARHTGTPRNNTSGFKGVSLDKRTGKWAARISVNGKKLNLGRFVDRVAAAIAYDEAASLYFGEFAELNLT